MTTVTTFIVLFAIATGVAILVRRWEVPYTVALVVVGLALGTLQLLQPPHLTKELLFAVFLPGLLFDAAFNLDARDFKKNAFAISALAVPGVLVGILLTGMIATAVIGWLGLQPAFGWRTGLVFGALVAATDPIAVVALFKHLNAPPRLRVLVEGESLLNDGTSIVVLTLILAFVSGTATSIGAILLQFTTIVGGGALVGAIIGFGISRVIAGVDDAMIEITLTTIAAYGSFVLAEEFHYSGVIATVVAGMICGNYGRRIGMSASTQLAVQTFWEYVAFALNSVIFLLIGFEVGLASVTASIAVIAVGFVAMLAGRGVVILSVAAMLRRTRESVPMAWSVALTWGGLRGALSMVLALALAPQFPGRALLVTMTFGVVVASILVQGLSMPVVLRRLGLVAPHGEGLAYHLARGEMQVTSAVHGEIERMRESHAAPPDMLDVLAQRYTRRQERAREQLTSLHRDESGLRAKAAFSAAEHVLLAEKAELLDRLRLGLIRRDAFVQLASDVDARLIALRSGQRDAIADLLPSGTAEHDETA